jgi:hypothetical protein
MAEMRTLYTDTTKGQGGLRQRVYIEIKSMDSCSSFCHLDGVLTFRAEILGFEASSPEHFSPVQLAAGFDRMAHDFFSGKPVLEDHDYTKLPSLPHSSVYTINYDLSDRSSACNALESLRELFVDPKLLLEPFLVDLCAVNRIKNMPEFHHKVEGIFPCYGDIKEKMEEAERLRRATSELVDKFKKGGLDKQLAASIRGNINALNILRAWVIKAATAAAAMGTNLEEQPITTADDSSSFDTQQAGDTPTSTSPTETPEKESSDPTDIEQDQLTEVVVEDDGSATSKKKPKGKKNKKKATCGEHTNAISLGDSASENLIAGANVGRNEVEDEVIETAGSATPPSKMDRKRKKKASQGEPKTVASSDAGGGLDGVDDINNDQLGGPNLQNTESSASGKKLPRKDKGQKKYCAEKYRNVPVSSELGAGSSMALGVDVDAESAQTPPSREHKGLPVQSHEINRVTSAKKVGVPATQAHQSSTGDSIPDTDDGGWEIVETKSSRSSKGSLRGASNPLSGHSSLQNQKPHTTHQVGFCTRSFI